MWEPQEREDQRLQIFLGSNTPKVACKSGDELERHVVVSTVCPLTHFEDRSLNAATAVGFVHWQSIINGILHIWSDRVASIIEMDEQIDRNKVVPRACPFSSLTRRGFFLWAQI